MICLKDLQDTIGHPPDEVGKLLGTIAPAPVVPEVKKLSGYIYHNYYGLGISLCFTAASKKSHVESLSLDGIDIYQNPYLQQGRAKPRVNKPNFTPFPHLPIAIGIDPSKSLLLQAETTGRDLVVALGEPSGKGGGMLGVDLWLEWRQMGFQVDLQDPGSLESPTPEQARVGMGGIWERAARWRWKCLKVFQCQDGSGL